MAPTGRAKVDGSPPPVVGLRGENRLRERESGAARLTDRAPPPRRPTPGACALHPCASVISGHGFTLGRGLRATHLPSTPFPSGSCPGKARSAFSTVRPRRGAALSLSPCLPFLTPPTNPPPHLRNGLLLQPSLRHCRPPADGVVGVGRRRGAAVVGGRGERHKRRRRRRPVLRLYLPARRLLAVQQRQAGRRRWVGYHPAHPSPPPRARCRRPGRGPQTPHGRARGARPARRRGPHPRCLLRLPLLPGARRRAGRAGRPAGDRVAAR